MKIIKKQAVAVTKFLVIFLDNGYMAFDEMEEVLIGKILGFGHHHKIVPEPRDKDSWDNAMEYVQVEKTSRLDLTDDEACAITSMVEEVSTGDLIYDDDYEYDLTFTEPLIKYLNKEFVCDD